MTARSSSIEIANTSYCTKGEKEASPLAAWLCFRAAKHESRNLRSKHANFTNVTSARRRYIRSRKGQHPTRDLLRQVQLRLEGTRARLPSRNSESLRLASLRCSHLRAPRARMPWRRRSDGMCRLAKQGSAVSSLLLFVRSLARGSIATSHHCSYVATSISLAGNGGRAHGQSLGGQWFCELIRNWRMSFIFPASFFSQSPLSLASEVRTTSDCLSHMLRSVDFRATAGQK